MGENVITLNCKFITPAFIYGTSNKPEIRACSIKGLMRFWWRASYAQFTDIEEMKEKEIEIFGGILKKNNKEIKHKAKVQIFADLDKSNSHIEDNANLVQKYEDKNNDLLGCKYLFYTIGLGNKEKQYFDEGTWFNVKFIFKEKDKKYVYEYLRSFNLLQILGGIGSRSRRGGGNFVVTSINNNSVADIDEIKNNIYVEQWEKDKNLNFYLKKLYEMRKNIYLKYSNIVSDETKIYIINFKSEKNYSNPLNIIGGKYISARNNASKELLRINKNKKINKYKQRGRSPLIIKLLKDEKDYKVLIIKLAGERNYFSPQIKDNKKNRFIDVDENNVFDKLVEICDSKVELDDLFRRKW